MLVAYMPWESGSGMEGQITEADATFTHNL